METGLEASHLSQHLAVLRRHRLVDFERRASHVYYRLAFPDVAELLAVARRLPAAADYRPLRRSWRSDLLAVLTVGIVALPLALGFGICAGAGAEAGIVAAIVVVTVLALVLPTPLADIGARTRLASMSHAVVLLLVVLVAAHPVALIPLAALSGVLMVIAVRMVHFATVRSILRSTRADAVAPIVTAIVTISVDLIVAVVIGMVVAGVFAIRGLSRAMGVTREASATTGTCSPRCPTPSSMREVTWRASGPPAELRARAPRPWRVA